MSRVDLLRPNVIQSDDRRLLRQPCRRFAGNVNGDECPCSNRTQPQIILERVGRRGECLEEGAEIQEIGGEVEVGDAIAPFFDRLEDKPIAACAAD